MKQILLVIIALILFNLTYGQVTDIDGKTYKTIKIGNQIWMAENLNVSHFRNGDRIPYLNKEYQWVAINERIDFRDTNAISPGYCYYNNDSIKAKKYGKLYNWLAVNDKRGLAPIGWHIPSDSEWTVLAKYLGGYQVYKYENNKTFNVAGKKMRTVTGWQEEETPDKNSLSYKLDQRMKLKYGATNSSGFSALPGGFRDEGYNGFYGGFISGKTNFMTGYSASWWSSTKTLYQAIAIELINYEDKIYFKEKERLSGLSIRCIKD